MAGAGGRGAAAVRWLANLRRIARQPADGVASVTHLDVGPLGQLTTVDGQRLDWFPQGVVDEAVASLAESDVVTFDGHPVATSQSGDVRWISADWSGSVGDSPSPWGPGPSDGSGPRLGWAGEVEAGGVVWLRNRVYDPATRAFLSRDPLAGEPTRPGGLANPYQYASNDPVNRRDPSGLKPVTAAEADKQIASWTTPQWGKIASAAELVGGVALCFTPLAPIGAGILLGEATSVGSQMLLNHGQVDWNNIAISGAIGGVGGGAGMALDGLAGAGGAGAETLAPGTVADQGGAGITNVFRVEGPGNARLDISPAGDVAIKSDNTLFLNFGDQTRAQESLATRLSQGFEGTSVKSFQVPSSYVNELRGTAVPESRAPDIETRSRWSAP